MQGKNTDAVEAWLEYLKWYPAGRRAIQAADNLNALGNFSFENHSLGWRTVTLAEIRFPHSKNNVSIISYPSLRLIGAIVSNLEKGKLQIIVYQSHGKEIARKRALSLKKTLHELFPQIAVDRTRISWFGVSDSIVKNGRKYYKNQSVRFFLTDWI